ncbi:tyrosine-type recombinase/integrase [Parageobacillus sp. VR-IP]|uniref:tyrosine-type recombinase/integrase n=1 Tax=Parageobacillus sp. VR-IP TaxID=2742205 RepID=UPI0015828C29|nr:tyrosine-type recombinase/integrase [Parageobacillus sp. VR-IP]
MEECNRFLEYAEKDSKPHFYILYLLAIYTGMRRGEILGLKWTDVNFEQKKISVSKALYYTKENEIFEQSTRSKYVVKWQKIQRNSLIEQGCCAFVFTSRV